MSVLPSDYATATYDTEMERIINNAPSRQKPDARSKKAEPRAAALSQVEHDTAGQQERVHRQIVREGQEKVAEPVTPTDKVARDTARYEALAREHGADLSEEGFNEALRKVGRAKL